MNWVLVAWFACAVGAGDLPPPPLVRAEDVVAVAEQAPPRLGVALDLGVPDGIGASVLIRPVPWLRLHAGVATNAISPGVRLGVSVLPFSTVVAPSLTIEAGRFFEGNANGVAQTVSDNPEYHAPALERVSYDFASAHLGLEIGSPRRFVFSFRAGVSVVQLRIPLIQRQIDQLAALWPIQIPGFPEALTLPSLKLGLVFFFG